MIPAALPRLDNPVEQIHNRAATMPDAGRKLRPEVALIMVACLAGCFLRVHAYWVNRSLWLDEARLALNLVDRSFIGLFQPLTYDQGAPVGFLLLQKAVVTLFGSRDYVLRLIPLLAGLAAFPLMYRVARQYGGRFVAVLTLGLFALSPRLIYYSSELKQYSTDVLAALLLLLIAPKCLEEEAAPRAFVTLGVAGSLAIWFSHPALFVASGVLLALGLVVAARRDARRLFWLAGAAAALGLSLGLVYITNLRHLATNSSLAGYWDASFAPPLPWSDLGWYGRALAGMLRDPARLPATALTAGLLILGAISLAFRRWQFMLVVLLPFLLTLVASSLRKYPFSGRLLLFFLPVLLMLLAEGLDRVRTLLLKVNRPLTWAAVVSLVLYLLYLPVGVAIRGLRSPWLGEHIKPVMAHVRDNRLDDDLVCVYYGAGPAFQYYAPRYGFGPAYHVVGSWDSRDDTVRLLADVEFARGSSRAWFVFAHNYDWGTVNEQDLVLGHLDRIGQKKGEFTSAGASAYLYDLKSVRQ